jgi:hypothetical protein
MKPTVGRIVHYHESSTSLPLAAIVVAVFGDGTASLAVFTGRATRKGRAEVAFYRGAPFSDVPQTGCWSWPPREGT